MFAQHAIAIAAAWSHIVRATDPGALCIVGTYRDSELARTYPLAEMLADLRREPIGVTRLALRGLDEPHVQGLVRSVTGHDAPETLGRAVFDSTGGNPLYFAKIATTARIATHTSTPQFE